MTSASTPSRPLRIGAVLRELGSEFPDVTISKIRFLESEGLLTPQRTSAGYRLYSPQDLDRLRYVLRAQRDTYWPLRVIRENLDALDRGLKPVDGRAAGSRPEPPPVVPDAELPQPTELARPTALRLTRAEVASASGCDSETLAGLERFGLLRPDAGGYLGEPALQVAAAAAELAAYGIEPRHLRPFRTAADREVGLVDQAVAGRGDDPDGERRGAVAALCLRLHVALVKEGLGPG